MDTHKDTGLPVPPAAQVELAVTTLGLLAEPTRLRVLAALTAGEHAVGELAALVGVSQSVASQHLAKLRLGGLVRTRRAGTRIYYALADVHLAQLIEEALSHAEHLSSGLPDHPRTLRRR